jgi:DNA modification methylase
VTSPPYWGLRDYGTVGQFGLERTPEEYIARMVEVFREVKRVLRDDGTLWLNMGDSYWASGQGFGDTKTTNKNHSGSRERKKPEWPDCGLKPKDLVGIPWMLAFALRADGWYLRSDIIWSKPNPMPESVTDRPTKAHEYIFLLSKSQQYYYNAAAIAEPATWAGKIVTLGDKSFSKGQANGANIQPSGNGKMESYTVVESRNKRTVWEVNSQPFPEAHFATFPEDLIKPCILAGCPQGGTVLDPFMGSGTTGLVARNLQCKAIGIELNPEYIEIAAKRLSQKVFQF